MQALRTPAAQVWADHRDDQQREHAPPQHVGQPEIHRSARLRVIPSHRSPRLGADRTRTWARHRFGTDLFLT